MYEIRRYLSFNQRTGLDSIIPHIIFDKLLKFSKELQQALPALCVIITQKLIAKNILIFIIQGGNNYNYMFQVHQ